MSNLGHFVLLQFSVRSDTLYAMTNLADLSARISACTYCRDRFLATETAHEPRPVAWLSETAPILIAGQAPGARVHASGIPFDDPSGDRLRDWLGLDRDSFYDRSKVAILPMAFCFPGYRKGSDLPPPPDCAKLWRQQSLGVMPQIKLTLLVGGYAQKWHLDGKAMPVTERVRDWQNLTPSHLPLPHPSWRNTGWLNKNPWFEAEVLPWLRTTVKDLLADR